MLLTTCRVLSQAKHKLTDTLNVSDLQPCILEEVKQRPLARKQSSKTSPPHTSFRAAGHIWWKDKLW